MMRKHVLPVCLLFACLQSAAALAADEDFYWKNSYGRGGGTTPSSTCGAKQTDAGLCYDSCKGGYHGVGPVCYLDAAASYGRGVGTVPNYFVKPPCGSKQMDAGLCYTPCNSGYSGAGPVCHNTSAASYGRGAGTVPSAVCGSGQEKDGGLCYAQCQANYKGSGPVCWGVAPPGYVDCGAGFAKDNTTCGLITTSQAVSAAMFLGQTVPGIAQLAAARKAEAAKLAPAQVEAAGKLMTLMAPVMRGIESVFKQAGAAAKPLTELPAYLRGAMHITPAQQAEMVSLIRQAKGAAGAAYQFSTGRNADVDLTRDAFTLISIVDPTNVAGVISAYSYPVYAP